MVGLTICEIEPYEISAIRYVEYIVQCSWHQDAKRVSFCHFKCDWFCRPHKNH